ncbi:MAG TPA: MFS transporter [Candidatus Aquilonibacter sp.]|nr:MFS transporter [Candidatus Aquilonibacter sp.]
MSRIKANPALLTVLWFGIQLAWGAVLGISLQARSLQLAGANALALFGVVSTAGAIAAAVVQLAVGRISDRRRVRGDKRIGFYVVGVAMAALALLPFYTAHSIGAFVVSFIVLQAGMNVAIGPYQAILPDAVPLARIGVASAWMAGMQSGGNAIGALLAAFLGNTPVLGSVIAVVLVASCVVSVAHLRCVDLQPLPPQQPMRVTRPLIDLFVSRAFVYVGFYTLLGYLFFYVKNALPPHFPLDATTASGIGILLFTIVGAGGAALAAKPADRLDERAVVTAGGSILGLCVLALALLHSTIAIPIVIALAGIGWGIFLCADWAFACRVLPPAALATTMAIWNIAVVGPQIVAPLFTTAVLQRLGVLATSVGPRVAFALAFSEILIGSLWIWRLPGKSVGK